MDAVQKAWNQRWLDIFASDNGLYLGINEFASVIVVGAFIFFAVGWVKDAIERGIFPALTHVIWGIRTEGEGLGVGNLRKL